MKIIFNTLQSAIQKRLVYEDIEYIISFNLELYSRKKLEGNYNPTDNKKLKYILLTLQYKSLLDMMKKQ